MLLTGGFFAEFEGAVPLSALLKPLCGAVFRVLSTRLLLFTALGFCAGFFFPIIFSLPQNILFCYRAKTALQRGLLAVEQSSCARKLGFRSPQKLRETALQRGLLDLLDICADRAQCRFNALVAALDVAHTRDFARTLGCQRRNHKRCATAQLRRPKFRAR